MSFALVDRGERLRHAVDERLDADEADARIGLRLRDQMLGAAEADFEPNVVDRRRETARARSSGARLAQIEREARQQRVEQLGLPRAQRMALAPAEERAVTMAVVAHRVIGQAR